MSLANAIKVSNDDAKNANDPTEIFNIYVGLRAQHDQLMDKLVVDINEKFNSDIKNALSVEQTEKVLEDEYKIKFKLGEGNVYITFNQVPSQTNRTLVRKRVLITRDSQTAFLDVEAKPEFVEGKWVNNLLLDLPNLTGKIQQTTHDKVTGTFVDDVKSASEKLSRNINLINNYKGNYYDILKDEKKIGGSINKGNDFSKILNQLIVLSRLFN